ncbi:nicotinate-nucleotide--dimethylbenzimidazole phosphoribosyltransferase [Lentilactobacillus fungorum]|uniref:Nicotinate-nucleotide--dimethylbenzimidazole phosphoribosyltransferase n=1 Tax=Lentilactobacillus fungorum TaxID=2201250 RepID=A0ABQ3VZF6_9LACO|nr:nicotinate-nucleotide--dimethylbenzimidazole phosphoribosyltransferase [Lentilactobacillus fungorum]GHP13279.1 nicotinate-nucleotide--dimethylbenzimidazole phosphoribosyltransferase [Lentilactobacillus fungorum]
MQKPFDQLTLHSISQTAQEQMQAKLDNLSKPIKGLGQLERLADKLAGIQGTTDLKTTKRTCLVYVADHGIVTEAVSATSEPISNVLSENVAEGHACVNALAMRNNCSVKVIDVGLAGDYQTTKMVNRKIQRGTHNMLTEDAMSREDALKAIQIGYETGQQAIKAGNDLILLGEVGLGNTTACSAIVATMLSLSVDEVADKGSDISTKQFEHKKQVIKDILAARQPDKTDPLGVLSQVGGFEIGATVGTIIAGAEAGVPVIMDGFISDAAAVLVEAFYPGITAHLIASHLSGEKGAQQVLNYLGLRPLLQLGMAVGEGSGAVVALALIDDIQSVLINMNTLQDLNFEYEN